jgi:hypothetical protein
MKTTLAFALSLGFATSLAWAGPADDVAAAARKLADAPNYSWSTTTTIANSQFPAMPTEGMTEKGGYTITTVTFNDNKRQTVRQGEKAVMQNREGEWMTMEELRQQFAKAGGGGGGGGAGGARGGGRGGFGMFGGGGVDHAKDLAALATRLKDVKVADGAIVGTLAAEDVATRLSFGRGGRGRSGGEATTPPAPKNASGTAKIWLKNGAVARYEINVKGTIATPNGDDRDVDMTTTTEIKDVGATKVDVPEAAKKKLDA